jgi:hypothetical protein
MNDTSTFKLAAGDFLCLNRLRSITDNQPLTEREAAALFRHFERLDGLPTGKRVELPFPVSDEVWKMICGQELDHGCICGAVSGCYYRQALKIQEEAERESFRPTMDELIAYVHRDDNQVIVCSKAVNNAIGAAGSDGEIQALKAQIGELQAEIEGLNNRPCKNCQWRVEELDKCDHPCGPDFGCRHFEANEGK